MITLGAMLSLLPATVCAAQVTVEFLPYAGFYLPMRKLLDHASSLACINCSLKQKAAVAWGGRLTAWGKSGVGFEATLGYSPSGVSTVGDQPDDSSGHVFTVSARVVRQISPTGGTSWLRLGGGLGYVSRGGGAYSEGGRIPSVCGTSQFAGVVSAGVTVGRGRLALRADAEDYVYGSGLYVQGVAPGCGSQYQCRQIGQVCNYFETASATNRFQDDLVLSVGLTLSLRKP